jgi:DNA-binding NtrC family response regulator
MKKILIVEDNEICQLSFKKAIEKSYSVYTSGTKNEALNVLQERNIDLILLDLFLPDSSGVEFLKELIKKFNIPIIIITQADDPTLAAETIKIGAKDFIFKTKFFHNSEILLSKINSLLNYFELKKTCDIHSGQIDYYNQKGFIPDLPEYRNAYYQAELAMKGGLSLLIYGESGVGKGALVNSIHQKMFPDKPIVSIDCGAIPQNLIESELFGYKKGAFTGAINDKPGKIELANEGVLFLDEIGNAPLDVQVKLLRVLQEKKLTRIGSNHEIDVNFILISATNKNLLREIEKESFKEDLYYRIKQIEIIIPPLRESKNALRQFINYFTRFYNNKYSVNFIPDQSLYDEFLFRRWPGNVRELDSEIQKIVFTFSIGENWKMYLSNSPPIFQSNTTTRVEFIEEEKEKIIQAMKNNKFKVAPSAKELGIPRPTLYYKLRKYQII